MVPTPPVGGVEQLAADDQGAGHVGDRADVLGVDRGHPQGHLRLGGHHLDLPVAIPFEQVLEAGLGRAGDVAVQRHARPGIHLAHRRAPFRLDVRWVGCRRSAADALIDYPSPARATW
jgi:hypothetical protein